MKLALFSTLTWYLISLSYVLAQDTTGTDSSTVSTSDVFNPPDSSSDSFTDSGPTPTSNSDSTGPTDAPSASPTIVQCYVTQSLPSVDSEETPVVVTENESNIAALPTGAQCYNIGPGGILEGTPFTTIGVPASTGFSGITDSPPIPTITGTDAEPTAASTLESNKSGSGVKVILPAVLGSVVIAALAAVCCLWYRKSRRTTNRQSMRAWVQRPGGWANEGFLDNKDEPQHIPLSERHTIGDDV